MNAREIVTITVSICLVLGAVGGIGGATYICTVQAASCLDAWKSAGTGSLAAATTGGTLLAQLESRRRNPEEPVDPPRGDDWRG